MTLAIVGPGKMGGALAKALSSAFDVRLVGRGEKVGDSDVVLFAVKPQDFEACVDGLAEDLSDKLVISIMAGVPLSKLREKTGAEQLVRAMPNLPVQVGKGFTAWVSGGKVDKDLVRKVFALTGEEMEVADEGQMSSVTAISGSGPAYFFYLCEALEAQAMEWGFDQTSAAKMARATLVGAAGLLEESELSSAEWRANVTSKGGTTEAAMKDLEKTADVLKSAFEAAKNRSNELSS